MMSSEKRPGEHTTIRDGDKVLGWIVERLPVTMGAVKYPFMVSIPSKYYGFKIRVFKSLIEGEVWIRKQW